MKILSLSSGSKGNAYIVEHEGDALLIDCGIGPRIFKQRIAPFFPSAIRFHGVLITHNHSDHTSGLQAFLKSNPEVPVYANELTAESTGFETGVAPSAFVCFENGQDFCAGPFRVEAFSLPHDASDPVGFLVEADEIYLHATDFGVPVKAAGTRLSKADVATVEFNHEPELLYASGRHQSLIRRISGPRGHLSNNDAASFIKEYASEKLKRVALAHLSQDCNAPHLALSAAQQALSSVSLGHIPVKVFSQNEALQL